MQNLLFHGQRVGDVGPERFMIKWKDKSFCAGAMNDWSYDHRALIKKNRLFHGHRVGGSLKNVFFNVFQAFSFVHSVTNTVIRYYTPVGG